MATIRGLIPFSRPDTRTSQPSPCIHHCPNLTFVPRYLEYKRHRYSIVGYTQEDQDIPTRTVYHQPKPLIGSTRNSNMSESDYASVYSRQRADLMNQRLNGRPISGFQQPHIHHEHIRGAPLAHNLHARSGLLSWLNPWTWSMWDFFTIVFCVWVFQRLFTSIRDALEREYQVRLANQDGNTQAQGLYQRPDFYRELIGENFITWPLIIIQLIFLNVTYILHWLTVPVRWLFPTLDNAYHSSLGYLNATHQAWLNGQIRVQFWNWYDWIFSFHVVMWCLVGTALLFSMLSKANKTLGAEHVVIIQGDPSQRPYDGSSSHTEIDVHGRAVPASSLICSQIDYLGRSTNCYWAADPTASIISSSGNLVAITSDGAWTEGVKSAVHDRTQHLKDAASSRASDVYDRAYNVKDTAASKASDVYDRAHQVKNDVVSKASDFYGRAHDAKDAAASQAGDVYDRAQHVKNAASSKAGNLYDRAGQAKYVASSEARVAGEYVHDAWKHGTDQAAGSAAAMVDKVKRQSSWFNGWPFARNTPYPTVIVGAASRGYPSPEPKSFRMGYEPRTTGTSHPALVDATRKIKSVFNSPNVDYTSNTQSRRTYSGGPTPLSPSHSSESSGFLQSAGRYAAGYLSYWFTDRTTASWPTSEYASDEPAGPSPGAEPTIDRRPTTSSPLETKSEQYIGYLESKRDYFKRCLPKWLGIEQTASQAREVESSISNRYQEDKQWTNQKLSDMKDRLAEPWEKLNEAHSKAEERMASYEKEGYKYTPDPRLNLPSDMTPQSAFETSSSSKEISISDRSPSSSSSSKKQAPLTLTQSLPDGSHFEYELELDDSAQQALQDSTKSSNGELHFELELTGSHVAFSSENPNIPDQAGFSETSVSVSAEEAKKKKTTPPPLTPPKPITTPGQPRTAEEEEEIIKYCRLCRQKHCCEWDETEGYFVVR